MEEIDAIVYINLNKRTDRREEMEKMFQEYGLKVERIEAVERSPGIVGCGYSHLKALKLAKSRMYRNILILEDDLEFIVSKEELVEQLRHLKTLHYDVVMLAYNLISEKPHDTHFKKVIDATTASAYIVHSRFYNTLISLYSKYIPVLESTGKHWLYANDQIWKLHMPTSNWFAFSKRLGKQRASFSDNTGKFEDYGI